MESFERLHNGRVDKMLEIESAERDARRRLLQQIRSNKYRFAGLRNTEPEGYIEFKKSVLKEEIEVLTEAMQREQRVLGRRGISKEGREDLIRNINKIEERIKDINYYLQEMAEGSPEPIEA